MGRGARSTRLRILLTNLNPVNETKTRQLFSVDEANTPYT